MQAVPDAAQQRGGPQRRSCSSRALPVPFCALPSPSRRLPPCPRAPIHLMRMQNAAEAEGHRLGPAPTPDRALECVSLRETLVTPDEATTALDLPLGHLPSAPRCRTSASPGRSLQRSAPGRDVELCGSLYVVCRAGPAQLPLLLTLLFRIRWRPRAVRPERPCASARSAAPWTSGPAASRHREPRPGPAPEPRPFFPQGSYLAHTQGKKHQTNL